MQKSAVTSKSDGVKKTSCSMCIRGSVEYTKPLLAEKKMKGILVEKRIGGVKSKETSYKKQVLVGSYIQL